MPFLVVHILLIHLQFFPLHGNKNNIIILAEICLIPMPLPTRHRNNGGDIATTVLRMRMTTMAIGDTRTTLTVTDTTTLTITGTHLLTRVMVAMTMIVTVTTDTGTALDLVSDITTDVAATKAATTTGIEIHHQKAGAIHTQTIREMSMKMIIVAGGDPVGQRPMLQQQQRPLLLHLGLAMGSRKAVATNGACLECLKYANLIHTHTHTHTHTQQRERERERDIARNERTRELFCSVYVSVNYRHLMYGGHLGEVDHSALVDNKRLDSLVRTKTVQHSIYAN